VDYVIHTPADGLRSAASVHTLNQIIDQNLDYIQANHKALATF
jgi:4-O-beta-D-mannosyl-D-glucose phosphorylase